MVAPCVQRITLTGHDSHIAAPPYHLCPGVDKLLPFAYSLLLMTNIGSELLAAAVLPGQRGKAALALGISRHFYYKLLAGTTQPKLELAIRLEELYDIPHTSWTERPAA